MKHFYIIVLLIALSFDSFSQDKQLKTNAFSNPFKTKQNSSQLKTLAPHTNARLVPVQKTINKIDGSFHYKSNNANLTKSDLEMLINSSSEISLKEVNVNTDQLGHKHETFQQYYKDLPIEGFAIFKHTNKATYLHGKIADFRNLDTSPSMSALEAKNIAKDHLGVTKLLNEYPVELKIIKKPGNEHQFSLVYEVRIDAANPLLMKRVFVDAKNGEVVSTIELIPHADTPGTANTFYSGTQSITIEGNNGSYRLRDGSRKIETYDASNANPELTTNGYSGAIDFTNSSTNWTEIAYLTSFTISNASTDWWYNAVVDNNADFYIIIKDGAGDIVFQSAYIDDTNTPVTFYPNLILLNEPYTVELWDHDFGDSDDLGGSYSIASSIGTQNYSDNSNNGSYVIEESNNPALDVHWGMEVTYDFYLDVFERNSFDGKGSVIKQFINPPSLQSQYGNSPNNASAYPAPYNFMQYGLGDGQFMSPVVGLDVEGHEFTHLVVDNNGNGGLEYQGESGALNESFADIFGVCVEFYSSFNPDWTMGEDIMISQPYLRSMSDPNGGQQPDTYKGQYWVNPENVSYDNGGVHINSGVQNFWFYLLSEGGAGTNDVGNSYAVTGIGIEKARQIAYRNLITYLGPSATYYDAYMGSLQAAEDLFGNPSNEYDAVRNAWYAVGISNAPDATCNGLTELTSLTGTVSDGSGTADYGNELDCSWLIAPPGANQITLTFTEFDTEPGFDTVFVYDGPTEAHNLLMTWWGNTLPSEITSSGGALLIRFSSDASTTASGWSANYTSTGSDPFCDGVNLLTDSEGNINDGSGTSSYGNNQECYWYIAPPCASSVTLSFSAFDTESDYDGLIIYDGIDTDASQIGVYTGSDLPDDITSTTGEMLLIFVSDYAVTHQGFNASYSSSGAAFCSETNIINDSDSGIITDGSEDDNYCNNQACSWLINPPDAESITLYFSAFDLEQSSEDGRTIYDAVEIYDGDSETASLIGTYTGSNIPPPIVSTGNSIFIKFYSDFTMNKGGWELEYVTETKTFCSGIETLTDLEGVLSDGSNSNNYGNNTTCAWLIQPENASKITLSFTEFDLEQDSDAVIVYDGKDSNSPILANLSGNTLPNDITSTNGSLYLEFLSDPAVRKSGWKATYLTEQILGLEEQFFEDLKIYPNPASEKLLIESNNMENIEISLCDLYGRDIIKSINLESGINEINVSALEKGIYFLNFKTESRNYTKKIIID